MIRNKNIYVDMDGVLFDFEGQENGIERFSTEKGFFAKLNPILKNIAVVKELMKSNNVFILSASPNEQADNDKMSSIIEHFQEMQNRVILCRNNDKKTDFIKTPINGAILTDDFKGNLINWSNLGGEAIKFINKYDTKSKDCEAKNIIQLEDLSVLVG